VGIYPVGIYPVGIYPVGIYPVDFDPFLRYRNGDSSRADPKLQSWSRIGQFAQ
jgi:hypothetical protein